MSEEEETDTEVLINDDKGVPQWNRFILCIQYMLMGIVYQILGSLSYEYFRSYLGVNGDMCNISIVAIGLPWSCKLIFGMISDLFPLKGYRRKPYMFMGWIGCTIIGFVLIFKKLPPSRFSYTKISENMSCNLENLNKSLSNNSLNYDTIAIEYTALFCLYDLFLIVSVVAMDGLMVQYSRNEPYERRGKLQSLCYISRSWGMIIGAMFKAFGLNWYEYAGPWCHGLTLVDISYVLAGIPCILLFCVLLTPEPRNSQSSHLKTVLSSTWNIISSVAFQRIVFFGTFTNLVQGLVSPADILVMSNWLHLTSLANNLIGIVLAQFMFILGTSFFTRYLLNYNWRITLGASISLLIACNLIVRIIVVYYLRNQYFYIFSIAVITGINGLAFLQTNLAIVELAENNVEGILYSVATTMYNLGATVGTILVNFITIPFHIDSSYRFEHDTAHNRNVIAEQYVLIAVLQMSFLFFIFLLPPNKQSAINLKISSGNSSLGGILMLLFFVFLFLFSSIISFTWPEIQIFIDKKL